MKILIIPILAVLLAEFVTSCIGAVYNRSVVSNTRNRAEPYATVNNCPLERDDSVSAEKTTDLNANATVATDSASAKTDDNDNKSPAPDSVENHVDVAEAAPGNDSVSGEEGDKK